MGGDVHGASSACTCSRFYPRHPCGWRHIYVYIWGKYFTCFYPRHPCGWRLYVGSQLKSWTKFLSTPPVWVATDGCCALSASTERFYPRHPCGWRRLEFDAVNDNTEVSIHATRVGGDGWAVSTLPRNSSFYPRHPCGWRLPRGLCCQSARGFYPRHPCGWRLGRCYLRDGRACFYPRHPCGWRRTITVLKSSPLAFLSTPPVWVATRRCAIAPLWLVCFYPRHPCGWRRRQNA